MTTAFGNRPDDVASGDTTGPNGAKRWRQALGRDVRPRALTGHKCSDPRVGILACEELIEFVAGLLDWRHGGDKLVVILYHEIDIGREFHGFGEGFQV